MSSEDAPHQIAAASPRGRGERPEQPEPYLRGCAFPGTARVPYPRAAPADRYRLPADTWRMATLPVTVRLEIVGDAEAVEVDYRTETDDLGYRGAGAGDAFAAWSGEVHLASEPAKLGEGTVRIPLGDGDRTVIYLPEGMRPTVTAVRGVGGEIAPAPPQPRWLVYGDSVAEGWIASAPALAWPAVVGRAAGLDVCNLGYAGAARGEIPSAEQLADLPADLLTVAHGTNCWTRIPHSAGLIAAGLEAFLEILRQGHPQAPIVVVTPVLRPDAEATPNRLGATLADLREAMEESVRTRIERGDDRLHLVGGAALLDASMLGDGIHPDDAGHAAIASAVGGVVRSALGGGG